MLESSLKTNHSHFLEATFQPADRKILRMRIAAFEMQLSHGVGG